MKSIFTSWFIKDMIKATNDMWLKGWDERNGGNISLRLDEKEVVDYQQNFYPQPRYVALSQPIPTLANCWFLVTGSGKYFRNVTLDPKSNLALLKIDEQGQGYTLYWGLADGGLPTSELAAHFQSHRVRKEISQGIDRVIMHCHATNLIALTYVFELNNASFTRQLWEGSTECLVVFPEGVGLLPWMVPGTDDIGEQTSIQMQKYRLVLWPFHGVFATGATLDEAFGLIDTAEKSAEILVKVQSMGGKRQTITKQELLALAQRFGVTPMADALKSE